jgi:hypothetical protein
MTHRVATQAALVVASFAAGARSRAPSGSYVVVGLEEPYRSTEVFPDGRLIKAASQNKLADNGPPAISTRQQPDPGRERRYELPS